MSDDKVLVLTMWHLMFEMSSRWTKSQISTIDSFRFVKDF